MNDDTSKPDDGILGVDPGVPGTDATTVLVAGVATGGEITLLDPSTVTAISDASPGTRQDEAAPEEALAFNPEVKAPLVGQAPDALDAILDTGDASHIMLAAKHRAERIALDAKIDREVREHHEKETLAVLCDAGHKEHLRAKAALERGEVKLTAKCNVHLAGGRRLKPGDPLPFLSAADLKQLVRGDAVSISVDADD